MNHNQLFSIRNVTFSFNQQSPPFFENVSLEFKPNSLNFIYGKNGMGKSTILKILSGRTQYPENVTGTICINQNIFDLNTHNTLADNVGFVCQQFDDMLISSYSFTHNLQCAQIPRIPLPIPMGPHNPYPQFLEKYGIAADIPVALLSGGQRQILSILMVLQRSPSIILLDEPTASMDEENANLIMSFLQELCSEQNITVVLIVHAMTLVHKYATHGIFQIQKNIDGKRIITHHIINNYDVEDTLKIIL